ncbi:MAG: type II toxin-antitoxin system RelE/ParE family toxin [Cyclobacteriaceae bacterium]|nr:type II toxin-antitoxin system RelE/ParE family toxin [Cyclobacteriaceae bacterium]
MEGERKIIWETSALETLIKALRWISNDSIQGAETVEKSIVEKLQKARVNPYRFPRDQMKIGNTGNFRYFISHSYRVSYRITETEIRVLRVRHVKQNPRLY